MIKPDDGHYRPKHVVFLSKNITSYSSPNIVRVIKQRRMRWVGHVARMKGEERRVQGFGGET